MKLLLIAFALPPVIVFGLQTLVNRLLKGKSPQLLTMLSMALGYLPFFCVIVSLSSSGQRDPSFFAYMFFLYSFSAYTYFHVFNMSETSRRIRMLAAIDSQGLDRVGELEGIYDEDKMIRVRVDRLIALGQIREEGGMFYPKGLLFPAAASFIYGLSRLLGKPWPPMLRYESSTLRR